MGGAKTSPRLPISPGVGNKILGIDLGTVNSCAAVVRDGRAVILSDETQVAIPSCLSLVKGKELVGVAAKRHAVTDPHNTVVGVKRLLGHGYESPEVQQARERAPYAIRPSPLGSVLLEIGGKELTPVQVSARILQRVRQVAEEALGETVRRAVISVPAHFTDIQRKATKVAAEYAGLEVVRLLNEPTAAGFAYGYQKQQDFTLAVYDLGGGTFDITVMTAKGDTFEVHATDGDSYLGGEDLDFAIVDWLLDEFEAEHGADLRGDETARLRLKEAAERAKIELTELPETQLDLPFIAELDDGRRPNFSRALSREKLAELARPLIERTIELCVNCLASAELQTADIDDVLLVGGQTRMPLVREMVRELFDRDPRRDINPDEVVAMGAALFGYSLLADDLQEGAVEHAQEAYAVAYKQASVARKFLDHVEEEGGDSGLAERLQELLDQAEAEASPPQLREPELRAAVDDMRDELMQLERKAGEVMLKAELEGLPEQKVAEVQAVAERFSEQVASAQEASARAGKSLLEAREHAGARRVNLIDVTSRALGIAAVGDVFSVLIEKNTPVPCENTSRFSTQQDDQTEVEIRVFQGEAPKASRNSELGNFILEDLPPAPRMQTKIDVRFCIDEDGILSVQARDPESEAVRGIRVEDPLELETEERQTALPGTGDSVFGDPTAKPAGEGEMLGS